MACAATRAGDGFSSLVSGVTHDTNKLLTAITEGVLTCVVSAILFFFISDFPEEVKWLSADEKALVKARLYADVGESGRNEKMTLRIVLDTFKDCTYHPNLATMCLPHI